MLLPNVIKGTGEAKDLTVTSAVFLSRHGASRCCLSDTLNCFAVCFFFVSGCLVSGHSGDFFCCVTCYCRPALPSFVQLKGWTEHSRKRECVFSHATLAKFNFCLFLYCSEVCSASYWVSFISLFLFFSFYQATNGIVNIAGAPGGTRAPQRWKRGDWERQQRRSCGWLVPPEGLTDADADRSREWLFRALEMN